MTDAFLSGTTTVEGHGGPRDRGVCRAPAAPTGASGVVAIHHMPGFDEPSKEVLRRFASWGYAAVAPRLTYPDAA